MNSAVTRLFARHAGLACVAWACAGTAVAAETIGKVSSPLTLGALVSLDEQRALGLVTIVTGCSGTLLNRYWVLTADHCVTSNGTINGPAAPLASLGIRAAWSTETPSPTRVVRFGNRGLDVAMIFIGRGDFGPTNRKLIYAGTVDGSTSLLKFGRGIDAFAYGSGPTATSAHADWAYRKAYFKPSNVSATAIVLPMNGAGQVGNGGDSGGPDFVTGPGGAAISIASVQSTCHATGYVPGKTTWNWATGIDLCTSASLETIRDDINRLMAQTAIDTQAAQVNKPAGPMFQTSPVIASLRDPKVSLVPTAQDTTCRAGYVWRAARPSDLVCVVPAARDRSARENADARLRIDPAGASGPASCKPSYVWREAFVGDTVCVRPEVRAIVKRENAEAASHRANVSVSTSKFQTTAPSPGRPAQP